MNDKERSEKLLGVLKRHNAEVNEIVEDWRSLQYPECKNQEVRIEGFIGGNIVIKFKKRNYKDSSHTHVEIWTEGNRRGYFHIEEDGFDFYKDDKAFNGIVY